MADVSNDLIWALTKKQNAKLVKRRTGGGFEFSRDPLNVTGKNTYNSSGFANNRAIGVVKCSNGKITLLTRNPKNSNKPAKSVSVSQFKDHVSGRRAGYAAAKAAENYRDDLRTPALIKASTMARADNKQPKVPKQNTRSRR